MLNIILPQLYQLTAKDQRLTQLQEVTTFGRVQFSAATTGQVTITPPPGFTLIVGYVFIRLLAGGATTVTNYAFIKRVLGQTAPDVVTTSQLDTETSIGLAQVNRRYHFNGGLILSGGSGNRGGVELLLLDVQMSAVNVGSFADLNLEGMLVPNGTFTPGQVAVGVS